VLVVDEHDLFRAGLVSMASVREEIRIVGQTSRGKMAVRLARELRPDVVLMDLRLPDLDGAAATQAILEHNDSTSIVVLSAVADEGAIAAALHAGACGYLLKDSVIEDVVAAVRAAAAGTAWLAPCAAKVLVERLRREAGAATDLPRPDRRLSPREIQVLQLLVRGLDNHQIASELFLSPRTVKNHVSDLLAKLGLSNRVQAAVYAVRHGIV
jgi:DNA-binding NarL/FixJ family response regulator